LSRKLQLFVGVPLPDCCLEQLAAVFAGRHCAAERALRKANMLLGASCVQSLLSTMCINMVDAGSEGGSADQDLGEDLPQSLAVNSNMDSNHTTASSSVGRPPQQQQQVS
jgi:hypothetical protein